MKVHPDIRTFNQLALVIPETAQAEQDLLHSMTMNDVKPDITTINAIIRRQNLRKAYQEAKVGVREENIIAFKKN